MAIYALGDAEPDIDPTAFVHPDAVIIGNVRIGPESSVWPGAVLRGDDGRISIGARTSIQDNSVVHCTAVLDTVIGDDCTIGHIVHLEGCTIESGALIGSGSIVLHKVVIGRGALVGANAVVPNGMQVPPGALAVGVPAQIREGKANGALIEHSGRSYVARARVYRDNLRRLD
jgi:carbonic anhydrase/acetyltransferase-like protein (isoleucine patch superfamily)